MIIPKGNKLTNEQFKLLNEIASDFNCKIGKIVGELRTLYPIIGDETSALMIKRIEGLDFIDHVARMMATYKLMAIDARHGRSSIMAGGVEIGKSFNVIAGHCTIDPANPNYFLESAAAIKEAGADMIRGGVWKPRTNPHSFQGDTKSMETLVEARERTGLPIVTEVMDEHQLEMAMAAGVDMLQVGARNALNYGLLKMMGKRTADTDMAVLLKRSIHMGPVDEFISAAEYIAAEGNTNIALCPRGTVPQADGFRNNPDESITMLLQERTWAPVIVDPSHSVGKAHYVPKACLAAASYGADGILVECHIDPKKGVGDDPKQAITPDVLGKVITDCKEISGLSRKFD